MSTIHLKFVIIIFPFCISCTDKATTPENELNGYMAIDFQGGFELDQVQISIDGNVDLNITLISDPHTSFAYRYEKQLNIDSHNIKIDINSGRTVLDTNIHVQDSVYFGVILDALKNQLILVSYNSFPTYEYSDLNDLSKIIIRYLDGIAGANFMPPVFPDPIGIRVDLENQCNSKYEILSGFEVKNAKVYLHSTDELLGSIDFINWPDDFYYYPGIVDTIYLPKEKYETQPFEAPCEEIIYIIFDFSDKHGNSTQIYADSIYFECSA